MTTRVAGVALKRTILLAVALALPTAWSAAAQNGTARQSVVPMAPMAADAHPSFEVATIKPADSNKLKGDFHIGGHRIYIENQSVGSLLSVAYAVHHDQVVDGPAWLDAQRYDIVGQADIEGVPDLAQIQEMLQKLLASRFNLKFHREKRDLAIYAITVAKGGAKLVKAHGKSGVPTQSGSGSGGQEARKFTNNSMSDFALGMQSYTDRPVVDKTGLAGRYDFVLRWTPDESNTADPNAAPGIFTAIQDELGLKLEPAKGPIDVLVIDHVERPSEN